MIGHERKIEQYTIPNGVITAQITIIDLPRDNDPYERSLINQEIVLNDLTFTHENARFCFDTLLPVGWRFVDVSRSPEYLDGPSILRKTKTIYVPFTAYDLSSNKKLWYPGINSAGMRLGTLYLITYAHIFSRISDDEYDRLEDADHLRHRRDAWAGALIALKKLREQGLDLEPELSIIQARDFAYSYLSQFDL